VYDIASDPAKDRYATARVSHVLKAPSPGGNPSTDAVHGYLRVRMAGLCYDT